MKEPLKHNPSKFHSMISNEWLEWAEQEIKSLRARLPKKVDGSPTEPGVYWVLYDSEWYIYELAVSAGTLYEPVSGLQVSEINGTFYGPIQPPEDEG